MLKLDEAAKRYNQLGKNKEIFRLGRTDYLVTRELPNMISALQLDPNDKILDFGCGAGLSTRFIKSLGYVNCIGIDINEPMLQLARENDPSGEYYLSYSESLMPFEANTFRTVIAIFVLFEISTLQKMKKIFEEISRVLTKEGTFIAITGSEHLYYQQWVSLDPNFPENQHLKSGDLCRIRLTPIDLILSDYYWTDHDYTQTANTAGFTLSQKKFPLGSFKDDIQWKDEINYPPFVFYEFKKIYP